MNSQNSAGRFSRRDALIAVLAGLLLLAIVAVIFLAVRSCREDTGQETSTIGGETIPSDTGTGNADGEIRLPGYGSIDLQAGTRQQTVVFGNPGENNCLIRISLILPDGSVLYESELVKPGYYTKPVMLEKPLSAGDYEETVLKYDCFTFDEAMTPLNGVTNVLTLKVR